MAFLTACPVPALAAPALTLQASSPSVKQFGRVDFRIDVPGHFTNAFDPGEISVDLVLKRGSETIRLPAFWYQQYERKRVPHSGQQKDWLYPVGMPQWRARFTPVVAGTYQVRAEAVSAAGTNVSNPITITSEPAAAKGFVRVSGKDPRFLEFADSSPFFPIGQNLAFIGDQQYVSLTKAEEMFKKLHENGANYLRIWTSCEDWAMAIEARKSAWGRSWSWKPPMVEVGGQKLINVTQGKALRAEPSHAVALRPSTSYRFSAEANLPAGSRLKVSMSPGRVEREFTAQVGQAWTSLSFDLQTGAEDYWLDNLSFSVPDREPVSLRKISLHESAGGPELLWEADPNRPVLGYYNPVDCFLLDELVEAAEKSQMYLQLCMLTRDLYMNRLQKPGSEEYSRAINDAKKFFRYAVARWGYSTSVAAWEYWNEMNPGLPTDNFYKELGDFLEKNDPYDHLRTTSTWGPSAKDCRLPALDIADAHFYLRPADKGRLEDEVHAVIERTAWLREQSPSKPAHLGEFGLADDKWAITEKMKRSTEMADVHNALWASALSGASTTAMFWWWERLDQRNAYSIYRPVSKFISDIPWNSGEVRNLDVKCDLPGLRVIGLRAGNRAWFWLFNKAASWNSLEETRTEPAEIDGAVVTLSGFRGAANIKWWDTVTGEIVHSQKGNAATSILELKAVPFRRDIACSVEAESPQ